MSLRNILIAAGSAALIAVVLFVIPVRRVHSQVAQITLDWTAPGDDGIVGTAASYEMRWSASRPDTTSQTAMDNWWGSATVVTQMPVPTISGSSQTKSVVGPFTTGGTYYFVIRACDEVANCSPYSNVASKFLPDTIPPARIIDLRPR